MDFLSHFGLQNSMVHEFPKYLRIIVQKYVTKYQLFSIFRIMLIFINIHQYANTCIAQPCENKVRKNNPQEIRDTLILTILRYLGQYCNSLTVNYKCIIRILTVFQKNTKKRYRTDPTDVARFYSSSRIALKRNCYEKLKNRQRSLASVSEAVVNVLFCEHFIWEILACTHL